MLARDTHNESLKIDNYVCWQGILEMNLFWMQLAFFLAFLTIYKFHKNNGMMYIYLLTKSSTLKASNWELDRSI